MLFKRKILVIYTGGTIGMIKGEKDEALEPFKFDDVYSHLPMLRLINAEVEFLTMEPIMDSSNTNPEFWLRLAKEVATHYEDYDGFVILHGTDTMSYTASALSFLLENLQKPVILTGSQLPLGVMRTDGRENILNSIEIASDYEGDMPRVPEVCIYFENSLYRGNRTYKDNAEHFNAFTSSNYPKLAEVGVKIKYNDSYIQPIKNRKLILHTQMDDRIAIMKLYPGITPQFISSVINTPHLKAIIMETYGAGNAPSNPQFIDLLKSAIDRGVMIVNVTQCKGGGTVDHGLYETSLHLKEIGVVSGYDITTEAAVSKLMFLLAQNIDKEELRFCMEHSMRGEMTH